MTRKANSHEISKLQRFEMKTIRRDQIRNAAYNPRKIKAANRAKLSKSLDDFGLVEPLIWNPKTGNLVGGHRRLEKLDAVQGNPDYSLTVAAVQLDAKREKALNIMLNNPAAQGEYDDELLAKLLSELDAGAALNLTGFEKALSKNSAAPVAIGASFEVIVECANEAEQKKHFARFSKEGLKCRVLTL